MMLLRPSPEMPQQTIFKHKCHHKMVSATLEHNARRENYFVAKEVQAPPAVCLQTMHSEQNAYLVRLIYYTYPL